MLRVKAKALNREQPPSHRRRTIEREWQSTLQKRLRGIDVVLGDIATGKPMPFAPYQFDGGRFRWRTIR
jgi:hypothetical protein